MPPAIRRPDSAATWAVVALFALVASAPLISLAQTGAVDRPPTRIGFVDAERLLKEVSHVRAAIDAQERELRNLQNQIEGLLGQYQKLKKDLERQQSILSEEGRRAHLHGKPPQGAATREQARGLRAG